MTTIDLKLTSFCDHKIIDERLELDGTTPNYTSLLKYLTNGDRSKIEIRDYSETEGMTNYHPLIDGITDFTLGIDKQTITFNNYIGSGGINFLDGNTNVYPTKVYLANYVTDPSACPKCLGTMKISDISFDATGDVSQVSNRDLIKQKVVKALLTLKGSNRFNQNYGSSLTEAIGKPNVAFSMLFIQQAIMDAINTLLELQSNSLDYSTDEEILLGVDNIQIEPGTDPRELLVTMVILSGTYDKIKVQFGITV